MPISKCDNFCPFLFAECELPADTGTCSRRFTRYYYDRNSGQCKAFKYSGCGGNLNNFHSLLDCNQRCICSRKLSVGTCAQTQPRYFYNQDTGLCQLFAYSGCGGNVNNFKSEDTCHNVCTERPGTKRRCLRRPEFGSCSDYSVRYFYDPNCDCCQQFNYSGCEGNKNNFKSEKMCLNKCSSNMDAPRDGPSSTHAPTNTPTSSSTTTAARTVSSTSASKPSDTTDAPSNMIIIQTNQGPSPGSRINSIFQQLLNMMTG